MPEVITIDTQDIDNVLSKMNPQEIDKLAFGAVQLDAKGKILVYNAAEGDITGRKPQDVIGKNFFTEVAPCTATPAFQGVFTEGVKSGKLAAIFDYVFNYNMQPTQVRVNMKKALVGDTYWIFVKRLAA